MAILAKKYKYPQLGQERVRIKAREWDRNRCSGWAEITLLMSSSGKAEDARSFSTYRKCDKIQTDSGAQSPNGSSSCCSASCILNPAAATAEAKSEEWKDDGDGDGDKWGRERARRVGGQMGPSGLLWVVWCGLRGQLTALGSVGWAGINAHTAKGKKFPARSQDSLPKRKWLVGGAMGQVGGGPPRGKRRMKRRVVCYRYPTANRANRGRRTLFPENVLENMNIISRKRKLQHLQGSDNARIRATECHGGAGRGGMGRT